MKRLFFIGCMMFMVTNIMAYQSVLVEGRTWSTLWYGGATGIDSIDNRPPTTKLYKVEGDSIINEMTYKKIFSSNEQNKQWNLFRLMREDAENAKVWIWNGYSNKENLEMDFSLNVGDIFNGRCTGIGQTTDRDGNILKVLEFEGSYFLVEGYGWTRMPLDGAGFSLISVSDETGVLIDFSKKIDVYHPMVVENYSWNVTYKGGDLGDNIDRYFTKKELFEGDSVIDGVVYKKLWEANPLDLNKRSLLALIREDVVEEKVFAYTKDGEVLIYDLGVEIGDTVEVLNWLRNVKTIHNYSEEDKKWCFTELVVNNIEYVNDKLYGKLKKITYHKADAEHHTTIVYERYGESTGWQTTSYSVIDGGSIGYLICAFHSDGDLVFEQQKFIDGYGEVKDCYIDTEINRSKVSQVEKASQNIYYNSQEKTLNVNFEGDEKITIYDTMGKVVMSTTINADTKSISLNLNAGIYIVTNKNQNIYSKFVVK